MKTQPVVIIGAGLSGLTSAYILLKNGCKDVKIYESSNRVGGKIFEENIENNIIELGAAVIAPWYASTLKLCKELGIQVIKSQANSGKILFDLRDNKNLRRISVFRLLISHFEMLPRLFIEMIQHKDDVYHPQVSVFNSAEKFLSKYSAAESELIKFFDAVLQTFCYPGVRAFPAGIFFSLLFQQVFNGGFSSGFSLKNGLKELPLTLQEEILKLGGKIYLNSPVDSIEVKKKYVNIKQEQIYYNFLVCSQSYDSQIFTTIFPEKSIKYTAGHVVVMSTSSDLTIHDQKAWRSLILIPETNKSLNIVMLNKPTFKSAVSKQNLVTFYILVADNYDPAAGEAEECCLREIRKYITNFKVDYIVTQVSWKKLMPFQTLSDIKDIDSAQGNHGIFFSGDYVSFSSLENAVFEGKLAAERILRSL
jgi:protoporphyrinogen oxidase